jgi:hypothetical protein
VNYVEFYENRTDEQELSSVVMQIISIKNLIKDFENSGAVNWETLHQLSKSRELFRFVQNNPGIDYNDYIEELDDDSNMTSDTLSDMNRVAFYFQSLVAKIKQPEGKPQDQGLHHLVVVLSQHFNNLLQTEKNFMDRISNCQANFSALN